MDKEEEKWEISHHNKKKIYLTFDNLFSLKYGDNYNKIININDNFLEDKFLYTLEKQHYLINILENRFYQSMNEDELKEIMKTIGSFLIVELLKQGYHPQKACEEAVDRIRKKYDKIDFQVAYIALRIDGEIGASAIDNGFSYVLSRDNITTINKVLK